MNTSVEVFGKLRDMSQRRYNAYQRILLHEIARELGMSKDRLLVLLTELENRGLVCIHKTAIASVSLTNYGATEKDPLGGLDS